MSRVMTAFRLAFYPALESGEARRFNVLTMEAQNARGSGDLVKAEMLYSKAIAEAQSASDPSYLQRAQHGLAVVYQEQRKYREAERIFQDQLEAAVRSPQPNTLVHGSHMSLAVLYEEEGRFAEAETHYKAALAETEKTEVFPGPAFWCSTSEWLAKFYIAQQRYNDAEPLFQRMSEILEEDQHSNPYLPHHLQEFAKLYEAQGRDEPAEVLYRRALSLCEEFHGPNSLHTAHAAEVLAAFCRARHRYPEAEYLYGRSLTIAEEHISCQTAAWAKGWRPWRKKQELQMRLSLSQIPIITSLDCLAAVYEDQQKYAQSERVRRRSLEIKERAWGARHSSLLIRPLTAYAEVLRKIGREHEASQIHERAEGIRLRCPEGSVRCTLRATVPPIKRSLRWRFSTFMSAILHPSRFRTGNR